MGANIAALKLDGYKNLWRKKESVDGGLPRNVELLKRKKLYLRLTPRA